MTRISSRRYNEASIDNKVLGDMTLYVFQIEF
jgi:hypothetical protein